MIVPSSSSSSGGGSSYRSVSFSDDAVQSPTSGNRGFVNTSFDDSIRKNLFVVSPEQDQEPRSTNDDEGHQILDVENESLAECAATDSKDIRSLVLLAEYKLSLARMSLELALGKAKDVRKYLADEGWGRGYERPPAPRRSVPIISHSIDEERNLRLVADLVLSPGKTLTLCP